MRRCLLRLGPAAVDPRGVELLSAHLSVVFLCGAFSPAASPLPTHQLREGADFLAPLPILLHSLRSRGDKHWELKSKPGSVAVSALAAILIYFYPPSLSLSPPPLTRLSCCRWTKRDWTWNEPADILLFLRFLLHFFHPCGGSWLRGASRELWGGQRHEAKHGRRSPSAPLAGCIQTFTARTALLIYLRWARDAAARALKRKAYNGDESFWLTAFEELASFSQHWWCFPAHAKAVNTGSGQPR